MTRRLLEGFTHAITNSALRKIGTTTPASTNGGTNGGTNGSVDWLALDSTQEYISTLRELLNCEKSSLLKTRRAAFAPYSANWGGRCRNSGAP